MNAPAAPRRDRPCSATPSSAASGGVSEGIYASLNCGFGSGDDPARVAENRSRAAAQAGVDPAGIVTAYQTHSIRVALVERPWPREESPKVDAMVTRAPGVALGILTADCAPVLFADAEARVVGAAHAGWRGAFDGVARGDHRGMCQQGAVGRASLGGDRPLHRPALLRGRAGVPRALPCGGSGQ